MEIIIHKKYIKCRQYYAERSVEKIATEIKSHRFGGNKYLSTENVSLEHYKKYDRKVLTKSTVDTLIVAFHLY